ncbi:MAG: hypothetical protein KDB00_27425 [Planctomycetales bacterium]|nr:hypothetical protein [Planctomycetales bacterium]
MLLHAFILGIGVVGKSIPQAWVGPILLGAIIASFIFSITGTAFIRRPMLARIICGLALLPCLFYVFIIVVVVFFFDLPAQD